MYACGSATQPVNSGPPRPFRMAVTPFAQDASSPAKDRARIFAKDHGDMVALHLDDVGGLPWVSLYNNTALPPNFLAQFAIGYPIGPSDVVYAAITPLNASRSGVVDNYGGGSFPSSLGPADFSNPKLTQAFITYARFIVDNLKVNYLAVGIEVNLYALANPADFANFVAFYIAVYDDLKRSYPSLIIFPTFQNEYLHANNQWSLLQPFMPKMDRAAIALYPSGVGHLPSNIPLDWISRIGTVTQKRLIIAETGYGSVPFSGTNFNAPGSEQLQLEYLQWLLNNAEQNTDFIVWFLPSDLPDSMPTTSPDNRFFYKMGLERENLSAKPALSTWDQNLRRPFRQ